MSASYRREGHGRVERYGDAAERPDLPRVARIAQAIAQKERAAGPVAKDLRKHPERWFGHGRTHRRGSARRAGTVPHMVEHQRVVTVLIAPIRADSAAVQCDGG
jgi:hypothetical protein